MLIVVKCFFEISVKQSFLRNIGGRSRGVNFGENFRDIIYVCSLMKYVVNFSKLWYSLLETVYDSNMRL